MASSSSSLKKLVVCLLICSLICSSWPTASSFLDHDLAEKFAKWARKYGRVYKNETERLYRLGVFSRNFEFVNKFAKSGRRSYTVGLNAFADLTNEEFVATHTGFRRSGNPSATPFSYKNVSSTPSSIDWRALGAVTPVKNQGSCGSCWAFSAVAAVEGITMIMNQQLISLSEQQLLDCDYANNGCNGGWMNEAFSFIISIGGITTEANYPFVGYQGYCDTTKLSDYAASISGYQNVPTDDEIALMAAVANQPVSVAVDASGTAFQLYTGGVFTGPCGTTLNHAVTVVGYGTGSDGTKYWIVKNSWGTNWGLQGYILMQKDIADVEGLCGIASAASYPTV